MSEDRASQKEVYRHEALRHRDRIDPGSEDIDSVADTFFNIINPTVGQTICFYWPKGREFDPGAILERALKEGYKCALPVVEKDSRVLKFARWDESIELTKAAFGVMQPLINDDTEWLEPDIVIVPMLAFDRKGHRLGYGGGYYDATLAKLRAQKEVVAVGVAYAQQAVLFNLPHEEHDQALNYIITPQDCHRYDD